MRFTVYIAGHRAGINPELTLNKGANGQPDTLTTRYPRDVIEQQLFYSRISGQSSARTERDD